MGLNRNPYLYSLLEDHSNIRINNRHGKIKPITTHKYTINASINIFEEPITPVKRYANTINIIENQLINGSNTTINNWNLKSVSDNVNGVIDSLKTSGKYPYNLPHIKYKPLLIPCTTTNVIMNKTKESVKSFKPNSTPKHVQPPFITNKESDTYSVASVCSFN